MNGSEHGARMFVPADGGRLVQDCIDNPLWVANSAGTEEAVDQRGSFTSSSADGECQFPVADDIHHHQAAGLRAPTAIMRPPWMKDCPGQEDASTSQQTTMMNAYIEKFSPVCSPAPVMGYYSSGGPPFTGRRVPSVLPEIDLSHRPSSLQEAICMYIDFLTAENEIRTRISECSVTSPPLPLDFHREEYYRDVMCRPVNFPTARFRDWLKRYNVDIEITDPDGQTVSQTTFAPVTPVPGCLEERSVMGDGAWSYADATPTVVHHRQQRSSTTHGGVICHGPASRLDHASSAHPFLVPQADVHAIPVEMLSGGPRTQAPMHGFTPAPTDTVPLASSYLHVEPPPDAEPAVPVEGSGYPGLLPEEEDETKEALPVSGWPDVTGEQPESSRTGTDVDCQNFEEDTVYQPLTVSSADLYMQKGEGTTVQFDSRCFAASDEAAAADKHWTSHVIRCPINNPSMIAMNSAQLTNDESDAQFTEASHGCQASGPVLHMDNTGAFPVMMESSSPSESGNTATVVPGYGECFADDGSGSCQLPCVAGSDQELHGVAADATETGTTTPPSQSTDTSACVDLGSDFADLLGSQHSDDFDYHLNYSNPGTEQTVIRQPLRQTGQRRRAYRTSSYPRSGEAPEAAGPAGKSLRRASKGR